MREKFLTEPKVCQDNVPFFIQQYVLQLDVSIDDAELRQVYEIFLSFLL